MPELIRIDPKNIPKAYLSRLVLFFTTLNPLLIEPYEIFQDHEIGHFSFTDSLIRWYDNVPSTHSQISYPIHFEVFNHQDLLAHGEQAQVYQTQGTLSISKDKRIFFSNETPHVIKKATKSHFSLVDTRLHQLSNSLSYKPLTVIDNVAYLVMEKAPGITLNKLLKESILSIEQRFDLALNIIDAAIHIAAQGIHHRDFNPKNIIVKLQRKHSIVNIIDFGVARFSQSSLNTTPEEAECFSGAVIFAPPELYDGLHNDNSDVYSISIIIGLIFGGHLRPTKPDLEIFLQGMHYAERMNYFDTLFVPDLPKAALFALEKMLNSMSFVNPNVRMNLSMARLALNQIRINLDAGIYAHQKTTPHLHRTQSCWFIQNTSQEQLPMKKNPLSTNSVLSLLSEEDSPRLKITPKIVSIASSPNFSFFEQSRRQQTNCSNLKSSPASQR